jgi:hypothetical protein
MTNPERKEFVLAHRTCGFGYNRKNHGPSMSIVYHMVDGDEILTPRICTEVPHVLGKTFAPSCSHFGHQVSVMDFPSKSRRRILSPSE